MKRRDFLQASAAAAIPALIPSSVLAAVGKASPSDEVRVGIAGMGNRTSWILLNEALPGGRIVAVADCHPARCDAMAASVAKHRPELRPETWKKYPDIRQMLEHEKLDAVFVETTAHARVWCLLHAMAAGCDVYGEKPLTLTIAEGRILADAARRLGRIVQTGTQQRSIPINAFASRLIREGAIGKVSEVQVYNFEGPAQWKAQPPQPVPQGMNWDLWTNQCPLRPYHAALQNTWYDYEDYDGGGQSWGVTGWGAHALDQVQCALGMDHTGPVEIWPEEKDARGWPKVTLRYANGTLLKLIGQRHTQEDLGAIFRGEKGNIEILRGHARANPKSLLQNAPADTPNGAGESIPHIANFLECVRSRQKPAADAETGHRSTTLCHLINICRKLGRKLEWDPQAENFPHDEQANQLLSRPRRAGFELPQIT